MATYQKAISGNAYKTYKSGTVVLGGNANTTSGPATRVITGGVLGKHAVSMGTLWTASNPIAKPLSAGTLAYQVKGYYVGYMFTTSLSGVAKNTLKAATRGIHRRSINYMEAKRTRRVVTAGWNYATGAPLTSPTVAADSFGTDDVAHTAGGIYAIPGELAYMKGAKNPVQDNY